MPDIKQQILELLIGRFETISAIAREAGVDRSDLSKWMSGEKKDITLATLVRLADSMNLDVTLVPKRGGVKPWP